MKTKLIIIQIALFLIATNTVKSQFIEDVKKEENKFIYSDAIKLFPGDSLLIEAKINGDKLTEFVKVDAIADSSKTITLKFTYEDFGSSKASLLKVVNPFSKTLQYKAKIRSAPWKIYSQTSIMPVLSKIFGIEMWPGKLESIIVYDFTLKESGSITND